MEKRFLFFGVVLGLSLAINAGIVETMASTFSKDLNNIPECECVVKTGIQHVTSEKGQYISTNRPLTIFYNFHINPLRWPMPVYDLANAPQGTSKILMLDPSITTPVKIKTTSGSFNLTPEEPIANLVFNRGEWLIYDTRNPLNFTLEDRTWVYDSHFPFIKDDERAVSSISISALGHVMAIGLRSKNNNQGEVAIFRYEDFDRETFTWQETVKLSKDLPGAEQGYSVKLTTDGKTVFIGAPKAYQKGAVLVYESIRNATGQREWVFRTQISLPIIGAEFGRAVDSSAYGEKLIVSAPGANNSTGAIFVCTRPENGWAHWNDKYMKEVVSGYTTESSKQGYSVAMSNDGDKYAWTDTRLNTVYVATEDYDFNTAVEKLHGFYKPTSLTITADGKKIAVGEPFHNEKCGRVKIFDENLNLINELICPKIPKEEDEAKIKFMQNNKVVTFERYMAPCFGTYLSFDKFGDQLVISAPGAKNGFIYFYKQGKNGKYDQINSFSDADIISSVSSEFPQLGTSVKLSENGNVLISGSDPTIDKKSKANGGVFIWRK